MNSIYKLIIIGSGPAGCSAGIYAARAGFEPIIIEGIDAGGQLTITTDVENYPGFESTIQGPWLMEQMHAQAKAQGAKFVSGNVKSINSRAKHWVVLTEKEEYQTYALIIATGAKAKWLGLESEAKFQGFGVSGCATCDGPLYRGKNVIVIGGGNTAVEEALYLSRHASLVKLIHRKDFLRAEKVLQDRLLANKKIEVIWNTELDEILGDENPKSVTKVRLKNQKEKYIMQVDGVFIAIGHAPSTDLVKDIVTLDKDGYIATVPGTTKTSANGIFAAGDVQDKIYRQAVTAAGSGCMAALDAQRYIESLI